MATTTGAGKIMGKHIPINLFSVSDTASTGAGKIMGRHIPLLLGKLRLTQGAAVIATGISGQTLSLLSQNAKRDQQLSPPYSLLIRLLSKYPELSPVEPAIGMKDFTDFVSEHTGINLGDSASIMLGQQKTWYYKAINGSKLSPTSSNLARMYMSIIKNGGGLDSIRKLVELEASTRGLTPDQIWKKGTWARNFPGKPPKFDTPEDTSKAITSRTIMQLKQHGVEGPQNTYIDLSYIYGVTQHRMIQLTKEYGAPLQLPPNAALITRCLLTIPFKKIPFTVPSLLPEAIFKEFKKRGIPSPYTAAVMMGVGGSNYKNMLASRNSNSYTLRLGYYIAEGCKRDPGFMAKYINIVNEEAMSRGMEDKEIFRTEDWPVVPITKKATI
ncbi:MAG TPA: hypothetical protein DCL66_06980 [Gammaproteobacteria bacterium]|nr:hypothetical protein [Gammaproteobacteria bacterium]